MFWLKLMATPSGRSLPIDALFAATRHAAGLLGVDKLTGAIAKNLAADIIAVRSNPLEDMSALREPVFVMKEGIIYCSP